MLRPIQDAVFCVPYRKKTEFLIQHSILGEAGAGCERLKTLNEAGFPGVNGALLYLEDCADGVRSHLVHVEHLKKESIIGRKFVCQTRELPVPLCRFGRHEVFKGARCLIDQLNTWGAVI